MPALTFSTLIERRERLEVFEALRGPERAPVLQYLISGAVSAAEARAFGQEARRAPQVLDVSASPEKLWLLENRPRGRRIDEIVSQATLPCPFVAAVLFGLRVVEVLRERPSSSTPNVREAHGALCQRSVVVDPEGNVFVTGFVVRHFLASLEGRPLRTDAAAISSLMSTLMLAAQSADSDSTATELPAALASVDAPGAEGLAQLEQRLRAELGGREAEALQAWSAWLSGRAPPRGPLLEMLGLADRPVVPRAATQLAPPPDDEEAVPFDLPPRSAVEGWVGRRLGELLLDRRLGSGTFAEVYHAVDAAGRECAVKVLPTVADRVSRARLLREARASMALRHENLVEVHRVGEVDNIPYLVMEYVDGQDLRALLRQTGPLAPARAARLIRQLASALSAIHRTRTIHRDVKPANILIQGTAPNEVLKLADMGLARLDAPELTQLTGARPLGTPLYMAPEQADAAHEAEAAADMYSVGVVLFEMIAGAPPFRARGMMSMIQEHKDRAPPEPPVADGLGEIALALLEKAPDDRPSADELIALLDAGREERGTLTVTDAAATDSDDGLTEEQTDSTANVDGTDSTTPTPDPTSAEVPAQTILVRTGSSAPFWLAFLLVGIVAGAVGIRVARSLTAVEAPEQGIAPAPIARTGSSAAILEEPVHAARLPLTEPTPPSPAPSPSPSVSKPVVPSPTPAPTNERARPAPRSARPAPAPRRPTTRVAELMTARGLRLSDLELSPELAKAARAVAGSEAGGPEEARFLALLERPELPRRLAAAKLERVRTTLEAMSESLQGERMAPLESRYLRLSSALERGPFTEQLSLEIGSLLEEVKAAR